MKSCDPVLLSCKIVVQEHHHGATVGNCTTARDSNDLQLNLPELAVSVQHLYKLDAGNIPILINLCMNVRKGTIYTLLGASGCGKSTLFSIIVGLNKSDAGEVRILNKRVSDISSSVVGFMPQDVALYDQLSIRENIVYFGKLQGVSTTDECERICYLLKLLQLPLSFKLVKNLRPLDQDKHDFGLISGTNVTNTAAYKCGKNRTNRGAFMDLRTKHCSYFQTLNAPHGGMRRRCSLAVALLNQPPILILDEPTVGLDPLLREKIWKHFRDIAKSRQQTIIVSSHFIEEAKSSDTIGLLRNGRIIAEDSPPALLEHHDSELLEEAILKICRKDLQLSNNIYSSAQKHSAHELNKTDVQTNNKICPGSSNCFNIFDDDKGCSNEYSYFKRFTQSVLKLVSTNHKSTAKNRVEAFSTIIWLMFIRNPILALLVFFLPSIQLMLTIVVLGAHPKGLVVGVLNNEISPFDGCFTKKDEKLLPMIPAKEEMPIEGVQCDWTKLSCKFINELYQSGTLQMAPIKTIEDGQEKVLAGEMWGYFTFPNNYSTHLQNLVVEKKYATNHTLKGSRVSLRLDMSNYVGTMLLLKEVYSAYFNFAVNTTKSCGMDPREFSMPLKYRTSVFNKKSADMTFRDNAIPIVLLSVLFEIPMALTALILIDDRRRGTFQRAQVAGLLLKDAICSHLLVEACVIIGQTILCSFLLHFVYHLTVHGSYILYIAIAVLCGIFGTSLGLLLGITFDEEVEALVLAIFICPVLFLLGGALWPVEGMASSVKFMAKFSPTLVVKSFGSVIYRGVGITHVYVWPGIVMMLIWVIFFLIMTSLVYIKRTF